MRAGAGHATTRFLPGPIKRLREHLREIRRVVGESAAELGAIRARLDELANSQTEAGSIARYEHQQLIQILRVVTEGAQWQRERLQGLRSDPGYEQAFRNPQPLVSVVIPTYDNYALLRDRSIPSVLGQTFQNFEIVVVGDAAPDEARRVVDGFDDARITFSNLPYRGPYPDEPEARWLVAGVPPFNEAVRRARGLWIAPLDDDDAFRPDHLERLLEHARHGRLELAYARQCARYANGAQITIGRFPPEHSQFGLQSALYHAGVADIFQCELTDAAFAIPYDWGLCLRMMDCGVRIGMLDEVTVDIYPSRSWTPRWEHDDFAPWTEPEPSDAGPPQSPAGPAEAARSGDEASPVAPMAPEWEYVPEGWDRARDPAEPAARGWDIEDVARSYREKWPQFCAAVEGPGPLGVGHEVPTAARIGRQDLIDQNAILGYAYALSRAANWVCARAQNGSRPLSVLDWGGALGHYQVLARRLLPEIELDYHCRELPAVCEAGRALLPEVSFHDHDGCLDRRYDLVVASNSLQYEQDWERRLAQLSAAADGWLFLSRVPVAFDHPGFVALQRAQAYGYATEYLGWVLNRDALLGAASAAGLELEREFVLHPPWEISAAPADVSQAGFLFRRAVRA